MKSILPGSTIGVLGSGQLGRMFAIAARRMGYRVHTFSPDEDTPTGQVADVEFQACYDDLDRLREFARGVDVVTFEFENVPSATVEAISALVPVRPRGEVLHITQNRAREKNWLQAHGFPVAPFELIHSEPEAGHAQVLADLTAAVERIGLPCVLKTAGFGYDGKGQTKICSLGDIEGAARGLEDASGVAEDGVLEKWISFEREVSVVAARGVDGSFEHLGVVENRHRNHILDLTIAPANVSTQVLERAIDVARGILEELEVVGVLCVEFFLLAGGELVVNELAPRPHNSGHWSFDAAATSQFELQLRAVCALPLGDARALSPCAMANLLGDLWEHGEPNWVAALRDPSVKLHLYGKSEPRPGRKMGHLCALAPTPEEAAERVLRARRALLER